MHEREAMAIVVSALGVHYGRRALALRRAGSASRLAADPYAYSDILGMTGARAIERAVRERGRILDELAGTRVHLVALGEEGYPEKLAQIPHPPHLLFVQGEESLLDALPIAVVGTRAASEYGLRHTRGIARDLARAGACIVSGLATGIDSAGHRGALDAKGRTIAVLGGAHDRFFPAENEELRDRILAGGGSVVSEYPMGIPPSRYSFLHRNRIIAGLSLGVLVTEGPERSGAMRTASDAADYGREVFALPGSVDASGSRMPHKLISEGAHLATCAGDILRVLAPQLALQAQADRPRPKKKTAAQPKEESEAKAAPKDTKKPAAPELPLIPEHLSDEERAVLEALTGGEKEFDELCEMTGIDATTLGALLVGLEMDGLVSALGALRYARSV